jgi:sugar-specific transcriptional regulator TrmB
MLTEDLIDFGLSEKEAKIYVSLLKLEIAPVGEISKQAEINRSTSYVTLDSLIRKGFVTISNDKNIKRYSAVSPEALLRSAENSVIMCENIRKKIERIVPEMMALHKDTKQRPIVKIYEGRQGLINVFEHSLRTKEKLMRVCSSPENLGKTVFNYMQEYIGKRYNLGIKMRGIHPDTKRHRGLKFALDNLFGKQAHGFDTSILLPPEKYHFPADLAVYDDTIAYMSGDHGGLAVLIESKEIAEVMKNIFDLAWEEAKKIDVKNI